MTDQTNDAVELAAELTAAWLSNPSTRASGEDVTAFLQSMHATVTGLSGAGVPTTVEEAPAQEYSPAVTARKSLSSPDHIISMIDGKPYKTLRRHLAGHGLTPEQYCQRYNLKADYPMVAPAYSENRKAMALRIGLGRKPKATTEAAPAEKPAKAAPKGRKAAQDAAKAHLGGSSEG